MKLAFASGESWGIDVTGWFGPIQEAALVSRLSLGKFYLDKGNMGAAAFWLNNFRSKVISLDIQGRLSDSNSSWLIQQATTALECLESIQN
jgi:hypothetical protein